MNKLECIAIIDFCYWRLEVLNEQLSKPKSNIEVLVDKTCGYNEAEEVRKECIKLIEQIIENKKAIGADYSGDREFLDKLKSKEVSERYEEADKICKCIEIEFDNFKRRVGSDETRNRQQPTG